MRGIADEIRKEGTGLIRKKEGAGLVRGIADEIRKEGTGLIREKEGTGLMRERIERNEVL